MSQHMNKFSYFGMYGKFMSEPDIWYPHPTVPIYTVSRNSNGSRRHLVALLTWSKRMPLRNRRSLWVQHPAPVGVLMGPRAVLPENDATHKIVFTLGVVVPYRYHHAGVLQLLGSYVEINRLVKYRINGIFLPRSLLSFNWFFEMHHCYFHKWIWKKSIMS